MCLEKELVVAGLQSVERVIRAGDKNLWAGVAIRKSLVVYREAGGKTIAAVPIIGNGAGACSRHMHIGRCGAGSFRALWVGECKKHRNQKCENTQKIFHCTNS